MVISSLNDLTSGLTITKKGDDDMLRVYHQCHCCGGDVIEKRITVDYRWGDGIFQKLTDALEKKEYKTASKVMDKQRK